MPIYEFYCPDCHTLYNFLSKRIDTKSSPKCPKCKGKKLTREVSLFAAVGNASEDSMDDLPIDDAKMEKAMGLLASETEAAGDDPQKAAQLMRKFTDMTGLEMSPAMQEAMKRLESGEDPDTIESEMGDLLEGEDDPFLMPEQGKGAGKSRKPPKRDDTLYEM